MITFNYYKNQFELLKSNLFNELENSLPMVTDSVVFSKDCSIGLLYDDNELVSGISFNVVDENLHVDFIETSEFSQGCNYATILINELIKHLSINALSGCILNSFNAFSFWSKIAMQNDNCIHVDEADKLLLNEENYDLELEFYIEMKGKAFYEKIA